MGYSAWSPAAAARRAAAALCSKLSGKVNKFICGILPQLTLRDKDKYIARLWCHLLRPPSSELPQMRTRSSLSRPWTLRRETPDDDDDDGATTLSPAEATMEETTSTPPCLAFTSERVQGLLPRRWPHVQQRRQHAAAHGTQPPARALPVRRSDAMFLLAWLFLLGVRKVFDDLPEHCYFSLVCACVGAAAALLQPGHGSARRSRAEAAMAERRAAAANFIRTLTKSRFKSIRENGYVSLGFLEFHNAIRTVRLKDNRATRPLVCKPENFPIITLPD